MIAAVAVLLLAGASPAGDPNDPDLRCLALVSMAVTQADGEQKAGLIAGVMYYFGRIDGRSPGYDLQAGVQRVAAAMTPDQSKAELQRCAAQMQDRSSYLQKVGDALQGK